MDLNSKDMWKPKLASYSKKFYSYFVSVTPQRFKIQTLCHEQYTVEQVGGYSMTPLAVLRSIKLSVCQQSYG